MRVAVLATIAFAFLFVFGQDVLIASPEPVRLSFWGFALLSLSTGARAWLVHRTALRERQASGETPRLHDAAAEMLAQTRG